MLPPLAIDLATVHAAARGVLQAMDDAVLAPALLHQPSAAAAAPAVQSSAAQDAVDEDEKASEAPSAGGEVILPDVPLTQPPADPAGEAAALVTCCQSGRRFHLGCLSQQEQQLVRQPLVIVTTSSQPHSSTRHISGPPKSVHRSSLICPGRAARAGHTPIRLPDNRTCDLADLRSGGCRQARTREGPFYATPAVRDVSVRVAEVAARGLIQLGALPGGTPVSWQLIRGGAVAEPDVRTARLLSMTARRDPRHPAHSRDRIAERKSERGGHVLNA